MGNNKSCHFVAKYHIFHLIWTLNFKHTGKQNIKWAQTATASHSAGLQLLWQPEYWKMLTIGNRIMKKLKCYAPPCHPHAGSWCPERICIWYSLSDVLWPWQLTCC